MPRPFLTHDNGEVEVYRVYRDPESPDNRQQSDWWFSTDATDIDYDCSSGAQFDIRDIDPNGDSHMWKTGDGGITYQIPSTDAAMRRVIHKALREGRLVPVDLYA